MLDGGENEGARYSCQNGDAYRGEEEGDEIQCVPDPQCQTQRHGHHHDPFVCPAISDF